MIDGGSTMVVGLNKVGLRRAGFTGNEFGQLKAAYRIIYRNGLTWQETLDMLRVQFTEGPASEFLPFFLAGGKRGFVQERRTPPGAIVRLVRDETDEADGIGSRSRKESRLGCAVAWCGGVEPQRA